MVESFGPEIRCADGPAYLDLWSCSSTLKRWILDPGLLLRCHVRLEAAERSLGNNDIGMCMSAMLQCCYRDGRQPCISSDMDHSCFCAQRLIAANELKSSPTQPKPVTPSETLRPRLFRTESPIPDLALDESRIHPLPLPAFDLALSCSCLGYAGYASSQYWQLQGPGPF